MSWSRFSSAEKEHKRHTYLQGGWDTRARGVLHKADTQKALTFRVYFYVRMIQDEVNDPYPGRQREMGDAFCCKTCLPEGGTTEAVLKLPGGQDDLSLLLAAPVAGIRHL